MRTQTISRLLSELGLSMIGRKLILLIEVVSLLRIMAQKLNLIEELIPRSLTLILLVMRTLTSSPFSTRLRSQSLTVVSKGTTEPFLLTVKPGQEKHSQFKGHLYLSISTIRYLSKINQSENRMTNAVSCRGHLNTSSNASNQRRT